jgi:hypothetical protein
LHAIPPITPSAPTLINDDTSVIIDWVAPNSNGAPITSYTILIRESDELSFTEDAVSCNGANPTILSNTHCEVPLATLTQAPYSLSLGDGIFAKVVATNVKGDSVSSQAGNVATIITAPDAPINLAENTVLRTPTHLGL